MRPLWIRWALLAVVVVAVAIAFVNLGYWQLDRLDQRRDRNGSVVAHEQAPVAEWTTVFDEPITESDQWRRVQLRGTFDHEHSFVVRYRSLAGETGYEIVTPLRTADGAVLINRGFAPRPAGQDFPRTAPPPPAGEVTVVGYVRMDETGDPVTMVPVDGQARAISSTAVGRTLSYPIANGYVGAISITPAATDGLVPIGPPELTEGSHFAYALQWFAFAGIASIGLFVFIRSDLRDRRKAEARAARRAREQRTE